MLTVEKYGPKAYKIFIVMKRIYWELIQYKNILLKEEKFDNLMISKETLSLTYVEKDYEYAFISFIPLSQLK